MDRMVTKLRRHFRKHGNNGYILLVDFKGYFENINHAELKKIYRNYFKDQGLLKLIDDFVDAYGSVGLGLGSETSQMHAIIFPNEIDHAIAEQLGTHTLSGRYMDDSFVIAKDKETLIKALNIIKEICRKKGIILSPKKTKIVNLKNCFKWLKTNIHFTETGKIIKKPCRESITRERRKVKKQVRLLASGKITTKEFRQSFESWAGSMKRRNARRTVWNMRRLVVKELNKWLKDQKLKKELALAVRNCKPTTTPRERLPMR